MNIICTSDVHLHPKHPERLERFKFILGEAAKPGFGHVIVAGDLFDRGVEGYHELEAVLLSQPYCDVTVYAIPGNHDVTLRPNLIRSAPDRFVVVNEPGTRMIGGRAFLFVPYAEDTNLYSAIKTSGIEVVPASIIVSHGDVESAGRVGTGEGEGDAYFPIALRDLDTFKASRMVVGHIHAPRVLANGRIHYPGSPYPLDPSETGVRKYLVLHVEESDSVDSVETVAIPFGPVHTPLEIVVVPDGNEIAQVHQGVTAALDDVGRLLPAGVFNGPIHFRKPRLAGRTLTPRTTVVEAFGEAVRAAAAGVGASDGSGAAPLDVDDFDEASSDPVRAELLEELLAKWLVKVPEQLALPTGHAGPTRTEVAMTVLNVLYGKASR